MFKRENDSFLGGFTLIEILIAILILNIGIALFFNAFTMAMKGILGAQRRILAVNYGQQVMEKYIMPKTFNNLSVGTTTVNNATSDKFKLEYQADYVNASNIEQVVGSTTDYKRFLVTVTDNLGIVPAVKVIMLKTDYEALEP
ncbi:MAG: prepilin-type N-terminal cleavage/methylation domain-containing protein [Candidatus Omnitrophica bacterium]|nr:prepilin-type N-terminal cleavage/methylation domain-containing protein [Candidatus Omnitrophota bacterium]